MTRPPGTRIGRLERELLRKLLRSGSDSPSLDVRLELLQQLRSDSSAATPDIDRILLAEHERLRGGLEKAAACQTELREQLDKLTAPPWSVGVYLRELSTPRGSQSLVSYGGQYRLVGHADEVELSSVTAGQHVLLSPELNLIVGTLGEGLPPCGETAFFVRALPDRRLVLKRRDEEIVVQAVGCLQGEPLAAGDQVRWDSATWLAYERIEREPGRQFFLEDAPDAMPSQVGGQQTALRELISALTVTLIEPEKAQAYELGGRRSMLMVGPPGCGKTLMARVAAAEVARLSGRRCRFAVVKPAEWENAYVGVTQENIRNCFAALKEAAQETDLAVLFLDEVESVGRIRGAAMNMHGDKFLAALLCELDGFQETSGIAIIAATNRKDQIDPALLERLSDLEIDVPRPDLEASRAIFRIHLPEHLPYSPNGSQAADTRRRIIETAVSRLHSPNADNELCTLRFRDGHSRTVAARDLASGRGIAQICRAARQSAFLRDVRGGEPGLSVDDIEDAVTATITRMAGTLTPRNVRAYLSNLPQDIDVVAVEPTARRVPRPHRFVNG